MLLAIDTATRTISLALYDGQRVIAENTWLTANHHTVELTPSVAAMLDAAGVAPRELRGVAVALGPGSFTGLRIGLGVAKGLALSASIALVGIPTLDALALAQGPPVGGEALYALLQAGRGRLAVAVYAWRDDRWVADADDEPFIVTWDGLAERLTGKTARVVGELDDAGRERLSDLPDVDVVSVAASLRRAGYLAQLGWARLENGEEDDPAALAPIYLHQPEGSVP